MRLVTEAEVQRHVSFETVLHAVRATFIALDEGRSELFDVLRARGAGDHFFAIKSGRDASVSMLGVKAGSYVPGNFHRKLSAHSSTTLLIDDVSGHPIAAVQANYLNGLRTSAANALATSELARPDAEVLGLIGIGDQAVFEALAVAHVRGIKRIVASGRSLERRTVFERALRQQLDVEVAFASEEQVAREADVLVTATPSTQPLVRSSWIRPGTHISAMGADNVGKQELDLDLMARSTLWVDDPQQAARIGESQHLVRAGLRTAEQLGERTLGGLLRRRCVRPPNTTDVTVFDSSGTAVQDIAAAYAALQCVQESKGLSVSELGAATFEAATTHDRHDLRDRPRTPMTLAYAKHATALRSVGHVITSFPTLDEFFARGCWIIGDRCTCHFPAVAQTEAPVGGVIDPAADKLARHARPTLGRMAASTVLSDIV